MLYIQLSIIVLIITSLLLTYFVLKHKKQNKILRKLLIGLTIALGLVFFVRYMLADDAIRYMFNLKGEPFGYVNQVSAGFTMFAIWFTYASVILLVMYPYFKLNFIKNIIKFFILPISLFLIGMIYLSTIGINGSKIYSAPTAIGYVRAILMSIEVSLIFVCAFFVFYENGKFKTTWKELGITLGISILLLLCAIPSYTFQVLFGESSVSGKIEKLNQVHRLIIYGAFIVPVLIYLLLRKKDAKTIKFALIYLSLATLLTFSLNNKFDDFLRPTSWPLHLCNTAMYIIPLCLIFKMNKLFYFTVFINVLGAFFALMMPSDSATINLFLTRTVSFYINHYMAFFMPVLMIMLKVYDRPKLKQFTYSMVAFAVYFVVIIFINAWFSNYGNVDYFYLNSDFIVTKLGKWAEDTRNFVLSFNIGNLKFTLYPLYQFLFFVVYTLLGLAVWFIYELFFKMCNSWTDMANRTKVIKLEEFALQSKLNGRSCFEPMNKENDNKLVLNNFSKSYGNSKHYAVKEANLTVSGGEIFGFLGPNGAGKSTIIKSIVGIQGITGGNIEVCGYDVATQSVMAKQQIGFVPDHYALYEKLTGREYINYIADIYEVSKEDRNSRIEYYVKLFELIDAFDNPMKTYSHGMKQKIAIMSALIHNPKLWILDEPLTGLDPNSIFQVKECMKNHAKAGNIVFFSSHIIDVVERICDKIAVIKKGKIVAVKTLEEIEKQGTLENFYLNCIKQNSEPTTEKPTQEPVKNLKTKKQKSTN